MNKICFLVSDEQTKTSITHTLWMYKKRFSHLPITTDVQIVDFYNATAQARAAIEDGATAIITNSGSHQFLTQAFPDFPVFCLYTSTNDALYTLQKLNNYDTIHLLLNEHFIFNQDACPPDIKKKLVFYPPYSIDDAPDTLASLVDTIPFTKNTAIVGCTFLPQVVPHCPMPIYSIRPNESTILAVYQLAIQALTSLRKDRHQVNMLSSILSHSTDGIILFDEDGTISHINEQARRYFNLSPEETHMRYIFPGPHITAKTIKSPSFKERIVESPPYTLLVNGDSYFLDTEEKYILTIRDVTELQRLEKNIRYKLSKSGLTAEHHFRDILTKDEATKQCIHIAKRIAAYDVPILIQGESGTGKELFAQSIHNESPRHNGPFVAINCAALPTDLLDSELFGYVGGSFTGARKNGKAGLFEMAHGGTIFLDEINSMAPSIQSKLLRVIETKQVMRLGSDYVIPLDIRIISAGNSDLQQEVQQGKFRRDLFFRINTMTLTLPPLDDRPDDIVMLFTHFLKELGTPSPTIPEPLKKALCTHHWWGNIRELYSVAFRYHVFGKQIANHYDALFNQSTERKGTTAILTDTEPQINLKKLQNTVQRLLVEDLLQQGYSKVDIAKILNVSRQTVFNILK